jgi:hypothetical protein
MFIFTSLFFLVLMITLKRYNKQTVFYLHATLFASFYLLNYITLCNLPVSIAFFKKFQYISLFAGTYFASLAIYNQYHKKINKIVSLALVPAIFLILIQSGVYTVTNILNVLPFLNLLSWLYPCFLNFRKNYGARTLLFASILLAICIGYDYLTVLTKEYNVIRSSNYGILFFCLAFMLLSYDYYLEYQNSFVRLTTEAVKEKEKLHKLAYTDGLTSLLNNTYLHEYFSL